MMSCIKHFFTRIRASGRHAMIPNPTRVRGLSTYKTELPSSSSSSLSSKYDLFFPSFYRDYMSNLIEFHISSSQLNLVSSDEGYYSEPVNKHPTTCPDFEFKAHYSSDFDHVNSEHITVKMDQYFDVISLLSTHADDLVRIGSNNLIKANDLRGKYIILCCGFVPSLWINSYCWREISILSSELSQTHIVPNNVEIVIIPKMRRKWDNDEGVFHHFFSAFPGCLTVPFTHKYRRDYICKSLNFERVSRFVLVDPSQKVLDHDCHGIVRYAAREFPFTDDHYLSKPRSPVESLAGLLCCESNPSFLLHKFDSEETISIEQLNKKHVGLYLFKVGDKLRIIDDIYQECRNQGLDFEIVLVGIPICYPIDPEMYQDVVHCILKKYKVSNWWVFPYNNSAGAKLSDLAFYTSTDSLLAVDPHNKSINIQAGSVIGYFGFHFGTQLYPFNVEMLLKAFLQRLDTVTLESFLMYDYVYQDYECDDGKTMPVSELKDKNVLVYVKDTSMLEDECVEEISQWYNIIKEKDSNLEVVFVPVLYVPDSKYRTLLPKVREFILKHKAKWRVCPFDDPRQSRYLKNHDAFLLSQGSSYAVTGVPVPAVLAFGKDGHLHSQNALRLFYVHGLDAYPFLSESRDEHLRREIIDELVEEFDLWEDNVISI